MLGFDEDDVKGMPRMHLMTGRRVWTDVSQVGGGSHNSPRVERDNAPCIVVGFVWCVCCGARTTARSSSLRAAPILSLPGGSGVLCERASARRPCVTCVWDGIARGGATSTTGSGSGGATGFPVRVLARGWPAGRLAAAGQSRAPRPRSHHLLSPRASLLPPPPQVRAVVQHNGSLTDLQYGQATFVRIISADLRDPPFTNAAEKEELERLETKRIDAERAAKQERKKRPGRKR